MERARETGEIQNEAIKTLIAVAAWEFRNVFGESAIPQDDSIMADPEGLRLFDEAAEGVGLVLRERKQKPLFHSSSLFSPYCLRESP